ncbi:MAG: YbaK/EbsC family protein [Chloroflexi bacterium]|nr:YbaK/EbsC family protein [Chloroflexota bacterium]
MSLSDSARRVQEALSAAGVACQVVELPGSTRTAVEAAQAVGCGVEQIVKSLVFRGETSGRPILIAVSGANRVREGKVKALVGEAIAKADADWVRQRTGYAIGGIPPVGLAEPILTLIDRDLLQYDLIWAAAGTPHAVFCLTPAELVRLTGGQVEDVG